MLGCINFGIVGWGAVSEKHGQAALQAKGARLAAVADAIEGCAGAFATRYLSKADKVYLDYGHVLVDSDVDTAIVATLSGLRAKTGLGVLDVRKHILSEKPLALTSTDAQALINKIRILRVFQDMEMQCQGGDKT